MERRNKLLPINADVFRAIPAEMPYRFDPWGISFTSQSPTDLTAILTYTKKPGYFGVQDAIIWAP
jgi:hypothetical protein